MFKKNLLVISMLFASVSFQSYGFAYDPDNPPDKFVESEYNLAKEVMGHINNKTELYRTAMKEYEQAQKNYDAGNLERTIYESILGAERTSRWRKGPRAPKYRIPDCRS